MEEKNIISPCITVCKTDPITGYCYGCGRTKKEVAAWGDSSTSNEWKIKNLNISKSRLNEWQLHAFNKSYSFKKKNGISLIKKQILTKKK